MHSYLVCSNLANPCRSLRVSPMANPCPSDLVSCHHSVLPNCLESPRHNHIANLCCNLQVSTRANPHPCYPVSCLCSCRASFLRSLSIAIVPLNWTMDLALIIVGMQLLMKQQQMMYVCAGSAVNSSVDSCHCWNAWRRMVKQRARIIMYPVSVSEQST